MQSGVPNDTVFLQVVYEYQARLTQLVSFHTQQ